MESRTSVTNTHDLRCFKCRKLLSIILPDNLQNSTDDENQQELIKFIDNGQIVDEDDSFCLRINLEDDDEIFCLCKDCKYYYVCCSNCTSPQNNKIQFCRFIGHSGQFHDKHSKDIQKYRTTKDIFNKIIDYYYSDINENKKIKAQHSKNLEILTEKSMVQYNKDIKNIENYRGTEDIPYYVGDQNIYYFDTSNVWATGPDGGFPHYWQCPYCDKMYYFIDK